MARVVSTAGMRLVAEQSHSSAINRFPNLTRTKIYYWSSTLHLMKNFWTNYKQTMRCRLAGIKIAIYDLFMHLVIVFTLNCWALYLLSFHENTKRSRLCVALVSLSGRQSVTDGDHSYTPRCVRSLLLQEHHRWWVPKYRLLRQPFTQKVENTGKTCTNM